MADTPPLLSAAMEELTGAQRDQLAAVLDVLAGDEHSPTSIRDPERATRLHLADSLAAAQLGVIGGARVIADLGSGAGFPGVPLAIALPSVEVVLVESQRRRCEFLLGLLARVGVANARVVCARAEEWSDGIDRNDAVVVRAVAAQPVVLEYAAPLVRLGGAVVDWRGRRSAEEERQGERTAKILGLRRDGIHRVAPVEGATEHHLHVFVKVASTPPRFPRRPGMARKRPLAG